VAGVTRLLRRLLPFRDPDPYWNDFVNRPIVDQRNMVLDMIKRAPGGGIWATKMDVHDQDAMTGHMTQLAQFWGADLCGIIRTDPELIEPDHPSHEHPEGTETLDGIEGSQALAADLPYCIVVVFKRDFPESAQGMAGRFAEQRLAVCNFNLRSYIREVGYNSEFATPKSGAKIAAKAGLGNVDGRGRLITKSYGDRVITGDVILTDMPMTVPGS
jgi:hypothetical protein